MIIYRIVGQAEAFPDCGLLQIEPTTYSTRAKALSCFKNTEKAWSKGMPIKKFDIRLEKLSVPSVLTKEQVLALICYKIELEDLIEEEWVIATARNEKCQTTS